LDVQPIEYPARGSRWTEDVPPSLEALAHAVEVEMGRAPHDPYALLGHSLGGVVAFQVARLLVAAGTRLPVMLCVVAAPAPHLPRRELIHQLPEDEFVDKVVGYGGVPQEVVESDELLSLVLPIVRADFKLLEDFECGRDPLPIPISVFGGLEDKAVSAADLLAWGAQTTKSFRCRFYPGGHFFLHDPRLPVIADVESDVGSLDSWQPAVPGPWQ
jgi:medium-chain acyl-[acyl-carrier-protein] hydrolase